MVPRHSVISLIGVVSCLLLTGCWLFQKSSDKAILSFGFASPAAEGVIDETAHTVSVSVPSGTDMTALAPYISVSPDAFVVPFAGVAQDFSQAVTYTVTAEDGSTQEYEVSVSVPVSGLALDHASMILHVGDACMLAAAVAPADAMDQTVTWSSSDPSVVAVSSAGLVAAVAAGSASITAASADGGMTAACAFTVTPVWFVGEWFLGTSLEDTSGSGSVLSVVGTRPAAISDRFGASSSACTFDGTGGFTAAPVSYSSINGNFSMSIWSTPDASVTQYAEATNGIMGTADQQWLVAPNHSMMVYGSGSGVCAGISCGTNCISVWEHTDGYNYPILV
jgi:hypothetical protein